MAGRWPPRSTAGPFPSPGCTISTTGPRRARDERPGLHTGCLGGPAPQGSMGPLRQAEAGVSHSHRQPRGLGSRSALSASARSLLSLQSSPRAGACFQPHAAPRGRNAVFALGNTTSMAARQRKRRARERASASTVNASLQPRSL